MSDELTARGRAELLSARRESRTLYWMVALFSFFVNMLMLTGPLYMLNVYDRVLGSRSLETLIALSVLVGFLYACMGILDFVRGRVMGRIGARFQAKMDRRVFSAVLKATTLNRAPREAATGLRDLEAVQRLITSPALMALFDLPWSVRQHLSLWRWSTKHPPKARCKMPTPPHLRPSNWVRKSVAKAKWSIHWACVGRRSTAGRLHAAHR